MREAEVKPGGPGLPAILLPVVLIAIGALILIEGGAFGL